MYDRAYVYVYDLELPGQSRLREKTIGAKPAVIQQKNWSGRRFPVQKLLHLRRDTFDLFRARQITAKIVQFLRRIYFRRRLPGEVAKWHFRHHGAAKLDE
jgi:hypothetical protein